MARYIGPKIRISRKFGEPILGGGKVLQRKNTPPGQHGRGRKKKASTYAIQLAEKQKAKYLYGVLEKQFYNTFYKASSKEGAAGENLLKMLESRLDNVVYRLGIGKTRREARQLVSHKHIIVNDNVVNIPSYFLKSGDIVGVRESSISLEIISKNFQVTNQTKYDWLEWDTKGMKGKFIYAPSKKEIPENINEQLIVELYSK
ncbi:MAG: 30S ribosomal protein S4 [Chitinophagaceae bacterium]|nr:30S ribosomal protein S4 [Chitinophagaceae bacterium]